MTLAAKLHPLNFRSDFPILKQLVHGKPLIYLDSAATSQKPQCVIDALVKFYSEENANIHRGVHYLSEQTTQKYEAVREKVRNFIHAASSKEIVFVRGTTEAINLVMQTFGRTHVKKGDEIVITTLEHHSNIVPWQMLCQEKGAVLKVVPINDAGELLLDEFEKLLTDKTKLVSVVHVSNTLGTINPVKEIVQMAHARKIPVLIDGAQAIPHMAVDVQDLDCDFYAFSGHKMYGPTGIGVLYAKEKWFQSLPPFHGGGDMILKVSFEGTEYAEGPQKYEAGTANIADAIALGTAIDYLKTLSFKTITAYERELLDYGSRALSKIKGLKIIGTAQDKAGILSFVMEGIHPHDIGTVVDREGVAIRVGHHCTMPLMKRLGIPATARASLAIYNTTHDIDILVESLKKVQDLFGS